MTIGKLLPIPSAPNPGGFDFGNYMKKKGVHLQLYGNSSQLTFISKKKSVRGGCTKNERENIRLCRSFTIT
jgi:predicted membrane metal-binding protein